VIRISNLEIEDQLILSVFGRPSVLQGKSPLRSDIPSHEPINLPATLHRRQRVMAFKDGAARHRDGVSGLCAHRTCGIYAIVDLRWESRGHRRRDIDARVKRAPPRSCISILISIASRELSRAAIASRWGVTIVRHSKAFLFDRAVVHLDAKLALAGARRESRRCRKQL